MNNPQHPVPVEKPQHPVPVEKPKLEDICYIPVRFSDIDMMRRVWHGSYVRYLEDGRESFGRRYPGIGYADIAASGMFAPIVDMRLKYYGPLTLNDVAVVRTRYVHKLGARLDYDYEITRQSDGALCLRATTTQLFIDHDEQLMLEDPPYFAEWKQKNGF